MRQLFKIVILGDGGVGKTTTIHNVYQYLRKKYPSTTYKFCKNDLTTINRTKFIDFHTITFLVNNQKVVWQIWDLQGQRFPSNRAYTSLNPLDHITETVITNADLVLMTYDASNNATFNELFRSGGFYDLIKQYVLQHQSLVLLDSKTDLLKTNTKDPINKMAIDLVLETISFNNTYLENISILSESLLAKLHHSEEHGHPLATTDEPVSLKVYK